MDKSIIELCKLSSFITKDDLKNVKTCLQKLEVMQVKPRKIYETILQSYLFCGFPVVIESLKLFKDIFPEFNITYHKYNLSKYKKSGEINCKLIYKSNYKKLISNMAFVSPELKLWMIIEGYGKILGRKSLSIQVRELINVSILTTRYFESQLHSHIKGCLNIGINAIEIKHVLDSIKHICGSKNQLKAICLLEKISKKHE